MLPGPGVPNLKKAIDGMFGRARGTRLGQDMIKRGFLSSLLASWSNTPESRVVRRQRWGPGPGTSRPRSLAFIIGAYQPPILDRQEIKD